jgi:glucose-6-phosphate 1-epimerase
MSQNFPAGITATKDPGGRAALQLDGQGGRVLVALCGAQLLSWHVGDRDVLWTASKPEYAAGKPVRGGVPLVFPWFGDHPTDKKLPAHGFARTLEWRVAAAEAGPRVVLATQDDEKTRALWPHAFALRFSIDLRDGLQLALSIENRGTAPFRCEEALHTYFAVGDVHTATVHGLEGVRCTETATAPETGWDPRAPLHFRAETDRVFHGTPDRLELRAPTLKHTVVLHSKNARSAIVWNPWPAKTAKLSQMAADDWTKFCCIETANVKSEALELAPGATHTMTLRLQAETR